MKKRFLAILLTLVMALPLLPTTALAAESTPVSSSNINAQEYANGRRWAKTVKSYLYENSTRGLTRVEYANNQVIVEDYNSQFQLQSSRTIPVELPIWGGFFAGKDCNFMVFGQNNEEENDGKEVIRIVKYSKDWQRLDAVGLFGANTIHPFDAGSTRFAEYNGYLYIHTCHEMYTSSDGLNHQASVMILVRERDMKITDSSYEVGGVAYTSHSFNQFILIDQQNNILALDHGDAYPRAITLQKLIAKAGKDSFRESKRVPAERPGWYYTVYEDEVSVKDLPAAAVHYNDTGAAVGGFAETSNGYVTAYNFDGKASNLGTDPRDVYLAITNKNLSNTNTVKLSSGMDTSVPVLASTGLDGGYVMWNGRTNSLTFDNALYYTHYDANGRAGEVQTAAASLSDCVPIVWNGKVVWYVTNSSAPTFYTLDGSGVTAHTAVAGTSSSSTSQQPAQPQTAKPTNDKLTVNGRAVTPTAYKINNANYFKLRDVAVLLNGSPKQFSVGYDGGTGTVTITTGQPYTPNGSELKGVPAANGIANISNNAILINGVRVDLTVYKIGGTNYFQIRDLAKKLDFNVGWTQERGMFIEGDKPYDPSN